MDAPIKIGFVSDHHHFLTSLSSKALVQYIEYSGTSIPSIERTTVRATLFCALTHLYSALLVPCLTSQDLTRWDCGVQLAFMCAIYLWFLRPISSSYMRSVSYDDVQSIYHATVR